VKHKLLLLAVLTCPLILSGFQNEDFAGVWVASDVGFAPWTFSLKATGNSLTGTAAQGSLDAASGMSTTLVGPFEIYDGKTDGNQISFKLKTPDGGRIITFNGTRTGDKIAFSRSVQVVSGVPGQNGILGATGATSLTATLNGNPGTASPAPVATATNAPAARPAPPTGPGDTWQATLVPGAPWTFELAVSGETLTGTVQQNVPGSPPASITAGKVEGTSISFNVASPDGQRTITFRGEVRGNELSFARDVAVKPGGTRGGNDIYGAGAPAQFIARRVPKTLTYRGMTVDISALSSSPSRDVIVDALRRQIDIVDAAVMKPDQKAFLKSVAVRLNVSSGGPSDNPGAYSGVTKSIVLQAQAYDRDRPILLHELLHAYHDQKVSDGFRNTEILRLYQQARDGQLFPAGSYMLSNVQEYFAMMASVYLHGSAARDPLTRDSVKTKQPDCYSWLDKEFGPRQ
jgi:hypothetical protein